MPDRHEVHIDHLVIDRAVPGSRSDVAAEIRRQLHALVASEGIDALADLGGGEGGGHSTHRPHPTSMIVSERSWGLPGLRPRRATDVERKHAP